MVVAAALSAVSAVAPATNIRRRVAKHRHTGRGGQLPPGPPVGLCSCYLSLTSTDITASTVNEADKLLNRVMVEEVQHLADGITTGASWSQEQEPDNSPSSSASKSLTVLHWKPRPHAC